MSGKPDPAAWYFLADDVEYVLDPLAEGGPRVWSVPFGGRATETTLEAYARVRAKKEDADVESTLRWLMFQVRAAIQYCAEQADPEEDALLGYLDDDYDLHEREKEWGR